MNGVDPDGRRSCPNKPDDATTCDQEESDEERILDEVRVRGKRNVGAQGDPTSPAGMPFLQPFYLFGAVCTRPVSEMEFSVGAQAEAQGRWGSLKFGGTFDAGSIRASTDKGFYSRQGVGVTTPFPGAEGFYGRRGYAGTDAYQAPNRLRDQPFKFDDTDFDGREVSVALIFGMKLRVGAETSRGAGCE